MRKIYSLTILSFAFMIFACSKDESSSSSTDYTILNNGSGGVSSISDSEDTQNLQVVQAIPSVENEAYSKTIPIILFFNDKIYLNSLEENFIVTQNGEKVGGTIAINEGANGYAILTFAPNKPFDANADIVLDLGSLQDDGGNTFNDGFYSLSYLTNSETGGSFSGNGSFESDNGIIFVGDGNIMQGTQGCVTPFDGNSFAAITTGSQLISDGNAIGDASSMMVLGSIDENISSLSFKYNFISAEFNEFVDSVYDDSVIVTVVGTSGAHSEFLTSVNTVGETGSQCNGFPNMPDTGDGYAGETGWMTANMNFSSVGSPAYVIITVSDVSDHVYSSVLAVDSVSF